MLDITRDQTPQLEILTHPREGLLTRTATGEVVFHPGRDFSDMARGEIRVVSFDYLKTANLDSTIGTATVIVRAVGIHPIVEAIKFTDRRTVSRRMRLDSLRQTSDQANRCRISRQPDHGKAVIDRNGDLVFYLGHDFDDLVNGERRNVSLEYEIPSGETTKRTNIEFSIESKPEGLRVRQVDLGPQVAI